VRGSGAHIHQLITTLAISLRDFSHAETIDLKASFEPKENNESEMLLSFMVPSTNNGNGDGNLGARLATLIDEAASLKTIKCGGSELALMSAGQLATALGGTPAVETVADGRVGVKIALPLQEKI
jgi:hypothetical protein